MLYVSIVLGTFAPSLSQKPIVDIYFPFLRLQNKFRLVKLILAYVMISGLGDQAPQGA